jgi:hypothetical protein
MKNNDDNELKGIHIEFKDFFKGKKANWRDFKKHEDKDIISLHDFDERDKI